MHSFEGHSKFSNYLVIIKIKNSRLEIFTANRE